MHVSDQLHRETTSVHCSSTHDLSVTQSLIQSLILHFNNPSTICTVTTVFNSWTHEPSYFCLYLQAGKGKQTNSTALGESLKIQLTLCVEKEISVTAN